MATILIKQQAIVVPDENIELYKDFLKLLKVSSSIRVGDDKKYTINDLINELPCRVSWSIRVFVDPDDYDKDCLYFVSHYSVQDFAKIRNVGKKAINEVIEVLKLHGYEWPVKKLVKDLIKSDYWYRLSRY